MVEKFEQQHLSVPEQPETQDKNESIEIAKEKLAILLGKDFKDFGIRFANAGELEEIIRSKKLSSRECLLFSHANPQWAPNFKEYLDFSDGHPKGAWQDAIGATDWDHSRHSLSTYRFMLEELRRAHREAIEERKKNPDQVKSVREATLDIFKSKINQPQRSNVFKAVTDLNRKVEGVEHFLGILKRAVGDEEIDRILSEIDKLNQENLDSYTLARKISNELKAKGKDAEARVLESLAESRKSLARVNRDKLETANEFINNPDLISEDDNLRKLFSTVPYLYDELARYENEKNPIYAKESYQYNVALVFNLPAISDSRSYGQSNWRYLKGGDLSGNELLGVVVIMPDREMVEKVVELSSRAGVLAYPVLTDSGNVAYPK